MGTFQPIEPIGRRCRQHEALFIVDCVTSLAGMNVDVDAWHIDVGYSATQKCLNCPHGLSPITLLSAIEQLLNQSSMNIRSGESLHAAIETWNHDTLSP
ncbi:MAG: aminotransferase class V-fold PLP-dependent enzyme [Nitrospirales bacterium]|nr:aminotransferase class V-fold PLP-dependent enzyme [Nitrospirales bacterium]